MHHGSTGIGSDQQRHSSSLHLVMGSNEIDGDGEGEAATVEDFRRRFMGGIGSNEEGGDKR